MSESYSTYEAKARFSELLRKVRMGRRIRITYHGRDVAEIGPVPSGGTLEDSLRKLEESGVVGQGPEQRAPIRPLSRRRGALERFLESRE